MSNHQIVEMSAPKFMTGCFLTALGVLGMGRFFSFPAWWVAVEVLLTILALFIFGSIRYRLDKNALTYGAGLVILATFWEIWWPSSGLRQSLLAKGFPALWHFTRRHFLTLHGLDNLVHADTLLFILGLTFFVAVIAQTRLLETASFAVLNKSRGNVLWTIIILAGLVSFASGILDGVSMIGLMIRTMAIILFLSKADDEAVAFAVMVSTVVTTVCGMWLAYGEPPNLIMKANLHPYLDNAFFLRYCLPIAVGSFFIVAWNLRKRLKGRRVDVNALDILDKNTADVRFLQALRHGEVLIPVEFVEEHKDPLGTSLKPVLGRIHRGEPLGEAMVNENVPKDVRLSLLGKFIAEDMAGTLDDYYVHVFGKNDHLADESARRLAEIFRTVREKRVRAQRIGGLSFIPFVGFLIWHALHHEVPLFLSSFAGFSVALPSIAFLPKTRQLAFREAKNESAEYLFLIPLFFSVSLLQATGFFQHLSHLLQTGVQTLGAANMAFAQFAGATFLSALLDNNVVADFAGHALHGLQVHLVHFFAMAQIAGYAAGGCWTHIGSAQSVVAFAFIGKEVNASFTPFQWMKLMTPVILQICLFMAVVIYGMGWVFGW